MSNLRTLLLTIVAVVLTVVFLVWGFGVTHSGVNSAQLGLMQGAQALIGASPNAVQVGVNNGVPSVTVAPPTITGVTWNTSTWSPSFTVNGYNLGTSGALRITDNTTGWTAWASGVKPMISARTNLSIGVSGFQGYGGGDANQWTDGQGSWSFRPGDQITIQLANNQTGQTATFNTTYPATAPMPSVTMNPNPLPAMTTDGTVRLSGRVAFHGTPLANQAVDLTATGGSFSSSSGQYVKDNPNVFMTFTDANGNWSATYTAPTAAGSVTITASTAGQSVSKSTAASDPAPAVTWAYPNGQTFTVAQAQATGCNQGVTWSFTPPSYGGYSGWSQGWDTPTPQQEFTSTSGCLSPSGLSVGVHRVVLAFFFAGGQTAQATSQPITVAENPNVSIDATTPLYSGASENITGKVTVGGAPDGGVSVALSVPSGDGTFSSATVTANGNGQFSDTYRAPTTGGTFTLSATSGGVTGTAPIVVEPLQIAGVTWNTSTWSPSMTVAGNGFGSSGILEVIENAQGQGAVWDNNPATPDNKLQVSSWSSSAVSSGNLAQYGAANGFFFAPGEAVGIMVTNGQTGQSVSYTATYPTNAPMPTVTLSPVAAINTDQSTTITGNVSFGGKGLANQQVNLTASGGSLSASTVQTDASGNFSVTYTAPNAGGSYTVTASSDTGSASTTVTVNSPPQITGVTWNTTAWPPSLNVSGTRFGSNAGNVEVFDNNASPSWWDNTGKNGPAMNPANAGAEGVYSLWSDTGIVLGDWGLYGQNSGWIDYFKPGDAITVYVENTQTGQTTSYNTTYPANAPMPAVTLNSIASVQTGQSTTVSGTVTWQGQVLNNALVTLSASGGTLSATSVTTNSNGQFSVTYTAPSGAGTETITASSLTAQTSASVTVKSVTPTITGVSVNSSTWPPQFTINGTNFGSAASGEYVQLRDNTRGWQGGTSGSGVALTVPTWNNSQIDITGMSYYGGGSGTWIFAPGDSVTATVKNPQTGQTGSYTFTYPANAQMPTLTLNPISTVQTGSSTTVDGTVTFGGQPLANQTVNLTISDGSLSTAAVTTNSNGQFSTTYTAPGTPGTYTVTASADTQSATQNVTVFSQVSITSGNTVFGSIGEIWPVTYNGGDFAQGTSYNSYVSLSSGNWGANIYGAPSGQTIVRVSGEVSANMYGTQGGTVYSAPYVEFLNRTGWVLGKQWIMVNFDGVTTNMPFSFTAPAGTAVMQLGWQYVQGYNGALNWNASWSGVTATVQ